jgi:hypothetical protein
LLFRISPLSHWLAYSRVTQEQQRHIHEPERLHPYDEELSYI